MAQNVQAYVHDPPPLAGGRQPGGEAATLLKVRGTREGLLLTLPDDARAFPPAEVAAAIAQHLDSAEAFFSGADVIVDLAERDVTESEIAAYRGVLEARGVVVRGFTASSQQGRALLRRGGYHPLQVAPPERVAPNAGHAAAPTPIHPVNAEIGEALYVRRTLRSGARLRHHGHLLLLGDINAGAEVAASGDIIVWGQVRGMVHAGALGDDRAIICALGLNPTQLRIGSHYALPPSEKADKKSANPGVPERVRLENGRLVVEPWKTK